ncbi:hypothetical protein L486_04646 [Kwoniella mangroviensis CBS 10435]|uniref:ABC transporter domain-containing protein n=1 Tax=Kwoniella mangroviensis CBS 10435 TaxID=1331196 RepID=A0A1B9IP83_9TREE|nr:hypothetical protein L486_04646 [Kwoniella mangroviensis CBS 10435]
MANENSGRPYESSQAEPSAASSVMVLTPTSKCGQPERPATRKGIFEEAGTIPLADAGYHYLGVCYENLTVIGAGKLTREVESTDKSLLQASAVMWNFPSFVMKLFNIKTGSTRELISGFYGVVPAGQTMLVLGRPGSGCSTFLRALANETSPFVRIEGDVKYSTIDSHEARKFYGGEIIFNNEEDIHEPTLSVGQTLEVAQKLKHPKKMYDPKDPATYAKDQTDRLLRMFGMPHVIDTMVGNDYIRGVSGGERKRVSLSEVFATNAAVLCWDNCIRGLDSAIAVHFLRCLKEISRATGMTNVINFVSQYQASEEVYHTCFDRVTVIYDGRMVFAGLVEDAQLFFIRQGWEKKPRQTTPDFLTACTSVNERRIRHDYDGPGVPQTPEEMAAYFKASPEYQKLLNDMRDYRAEHSSNKHADEFRAAVKHSKHRGTGKKNSYKVNFARQSVVLIKRQANLVRSAPKDLIIKLGSNLLQAVVVGSIFYKPAANASGSFAVAGGLFFTILYFCVFSLSEASIPPTVMGRALLIKHRKLGFYNPAAKIIAEMLIDCGVYALQTLVFASVFYFLLGLNTEAETFFTFWFIIYTTYLNLSVMYRMIGSWCPVLSVAIRFGGLSLMLVLTSGGFIVPPTLQHRWAGWISRISPVAYAFEALMSNEFRTRTLTCSATDLVPHGPSYTDITYQGCTIPGATEGDADVSGSTFIGLKYGFTSGHIWRNIGILWAMYAIYAIMVVLGNTIMVRDSGSASSKLYKRGAVIQPLQTTHSEADSFTADEAKEQVQKRSVFTFKNVCYTVQVGGKERRLLDNVTGIVEPGRLTALMGASGAGKTTLLNTIAGRQTTGKVEGYMLLDGKPLGPTFSRCAGFAQQGDVHEPYSTVRECLQFSAVLRQAGQYTRQEKLAYAEEVLDLLELGPIADALIGSPDTGGLNVEERKRVTIGVELAARPDSLLFLDEPTSGLDSQAAYEICRFLRKIAARSGLAICCVIHQPSGDLFEMFDSIILLAAGGKTCYAGPTGPGSSTVSQYFGRYGSPLDPGANPAEHLIATIAPVGGTEVNWPERWQKSNEAAAILQRVNDLEKSSEAVIPMGSLSKEDTAPFASSFAVQFKELLIRNMRAQYRDGSYWTTKLVLCVFIGLFIGFYCYQMQHSVAGIQVMSLSILVAAQAAAPVAFDSACNYQAKFGIYLARERLGVYSWQALVAALLVVELPINLIAFTLLFLSYYWTVGLESSAMVGGLHWLAWAVYSIYTCTFGVMIGALSPSTFAVGFVLSFIWNVINALSWALVPWPNMPQPYHTIFSWLSPLRWFYGSTMESTLSSKAISCAANELTTFAAPSGMTCGEYAAEFLATAAGYLINPAATSSCAYCQLSYGSDYVQSLGYEYDNMWRDWGVLIVHCVSNIAVAYLFTWLIRIRPLYKK